MAESVPTMTPSDQLLNFAREELAIYNHLPMRTVRQWQSALRRTAAERGWQLVPRAMTGFEAPVFTWQHYYIQPIRVYGSQACFLDICDTQTGQQTRLKL